MRSRTILLVEDNADDVAWIQSAFARWQVIDRLQVVFTGLQANDYLMGRSMFADRGKFPFPKLILLDLRLPDMSGFDVLRWLRSEPGLGNVPVVILTGSETRADIDRAYQLGANSYLIKTSDIDQFLALIQDLNQFVLGPYDPESVIKMGKLGAPRKIFSER